MFRFENLFTKKNLFSTTHSLAFDDLARQKERTSNKKKPNIKQIFNEASSLTILHSEINLPHIPNGTKHPFDDYTADEIIKMSWTIPRYMKNLIINNTIPASKNAPELIKIYSAITAHFQSLTINYARNSLLTKHIPRLSTSELIQLLKAVSSTITEMDISELLWEMTVDEAVTLLRSIPPFVIKMNIKGVFEGKTKEDLEKMFAAIPASVIELSVDRRLFDTMYIKKRNQLADDEKIFMKRSNDYITIPTHPVWTMYSYYRTSVDMLNASNKAFNLYNRGGCNYSVFREQFNQDVELGNYDIFYQSDIEVGTSITHLNDENESLEKFSKKLDNFFSVIPSHYKLIKMVDVFFVFYDYEKYKNLFSRLTSFNRLHLVAIMAKDKIKEKLTHLMGIIPSSITTVRLTFSYILGQDHAFRERHFFYQPANEIKSIIATFTPAVKILDIKYLTQDNKTAAEIADILSSLPPDLVELNLCGSEFYYFSTPELVQILSSIPATVTKLDVSDCELFIGRTLAERDQILNAMQIKTPGKYREITATNNGEAAFARVLLPLLSACKQELFNLDMLAFIMYHLLPISNKSPHVYLEEKLASAIPATVLQDTYSRLGGKQLGHFGIFGSGRAAFLQHPLQVLREQAEKHPQGASERTLNHFYLKR